MIKWQINTSRHNKLAHAFINGKPVCKCSIKTTRKPLDREWYRKCRRCRFKVEKPKPYMSRSLQLLPTPQMNQEILGFLSVVNPKSSSDIRRDIRDEIGELSQRRTIIYLRKLLKRGKIKEVKIRGRIRYLAVNSHPECCLNIT